MTTYTQYDDDGRMNFQIIAITGKPEDYEKAFISKEEALEWVENNLDLSKEWSIKRIPFVSPMNRLIGNLATKWEELGRDKFVGNKEELELAALRYLYIARRNIADANIAAEVENEFLYSITARESCMGYNVLDDLIKKGIVEDPAGSPTSLLTTNECGGVK